MLLLLEIGILSGFFVLFLNYCMGKPASEDFSPYEIFSFWTIWLSRRRLKSVGLLDQYEEQYRNNLDSIETKWGKLSLKYDYHKQLYNAADPFFSWERMVGMCPVCFGFWISLGGGLLFTKNLLQLFIIVLISHITIRILNKII